MPNLALMSFSTPLLDRMLCTIEFRFRSMNERSLLRTSAGRSQRLTMWLVLENKMKDDESLPSKKALRFPSREGLGLMNRLPLLR